MKKFLAIAIALVMLVSLCACAKKGGSSHEADDVFRVGMECNYAPFNWTQTDANDRTVPITSGGHTDGYDVQIAKLVAAGLGKKLEIVKIEWDGLSLAVNSGEIDAIIAGMSPWEVRKQTVDFSDNYYNSQLVIVVKKDSPYAKAAKIADFSGAKITGQLSTFHYSVIDQIQGVNKQTALETFPAMIVALTSGAIDGYVSEKPGALSAVAANPALTFVEFAEGNGFEASPDDTAIAVGLRKGSILTQDINKILAGITQEQRDQLMVDALSNQPLS